MKKTYQRIREINDEIRALADTLAKEKRSRTEEETARYEALLREREWLTMQLNSSNLPEERGSSLGAQVRQAIQRGSGAVTFNLRTESGGGGSTTTPATDPTFLSSNATAGGMVPLTIGDIQKPLREGNIIGAIGVQMPTGLTGDWVWPVVEAITATLADENVAVDASKIDVSKVPAINQSIVVGAQATYESVMKSDGRIESIIREELPAALSDMVNCVILTPDKVNAKALITGPFVSLKAKATSVAMGSGMFKALNKAKAGVLTKGYSSDGLVYVMSEVTKAELEATPRDAGSGIMVVEDGKIGGVPVYCSHYITDDYIGVGNFRYQVAGLFGEMHLVVDPYTDAAKRIVKFWLSANFGTATLRSDAFALVKVTRS